MDTRLALMTGVDVPIPQLAINLHQLTMKEVSLIGESDFFQALHFFCLKKEQLMENNSLALIGNLSNFQILTQVLEQPETRSVKQSLSKFLLFIFPGYQPVFTPNSILLTNLDTKETKMIDNNNFDILVQVIEEVFCVSSLFQGDNVVYKPANAAAKKIMDKIMAGRKKVAELKAKEDNHASIFGRYLSILAIGLQYDLNQCSNLTMYQLFDLIERYSLYQEWDIDLRARLAGADPKKEIDNWMKNIH